ncbi:MAG: hypothetical protein PWQ96_70 [Clostridia bacterium]|jgi:hypothetical protein|nr:hypothetical protein [Clostridiales bacterium]MDK2984428.1 hypothetical protein [Clostridia bacterium]
MYNKLADAKDLTEPWVKDFMKKVLGKNLVFTNILRKLPLRQFSQFLRSS